MVFPPLEPEDAAAEEVEEGSEKEEGRAVGELAGEVGEAAAELVDEALIVVKMPCPVIPNEAISEAAPFS